MSHSCRIAVTASLLLLALAGCDGMESAHHVGVEEPLFKDHMRSDSIWRYDNEIFHVKARDDSSAVAAALAWDDKEERFRLHEKEILVTRLGDQLFLNVKEGEYYRIFRLGYTQDGSGAPAFVVYRADTKKLKRDARAGRIKTMKSDSKHVVRLDISKKKLDAYVERNMSTLFEYDQVELITMVRRPSPDPEPDAGAPDEDPALPAADAGVAPDVIPAP